MVINVEGLKTDGKNYCKKNKCKTCKLKKEVCINEDGNIRLKGHIDFNDFQDSFMVMVGEIV